MAETSTQIEQEIEQTRAQLGSNLEELENKVKDIADWRRQFRRNPFTMMGVAFGGGLLLATLMHRNHRAPEPRPERRKNELTAWDGIRDALVGAAASKIMKQVVAAL